MKKEVVRFSFPTMTSFGLGAVAMFPENLEEVGVSKPMIV
jgi:hypothetical protein